jgi:hypothetical protein
MIVKFRPEYLLLLDLEKIKFVFSCALFVTQSHYSSTAGVDWKMMTCCWNLRLDRFTCVIHRQKSEEISTNSHDWKAIRNRFQITQISGKISLILAVSNGTLKFSIGRPPSQPSNKNRQSVEPVSRRSKSTNGSTACEPLPRSAASARRSYNGFECTAPSRR